MFIRMREEENTHRRRLIEVHRERFGEHIPLIRRADVKGFVQPKAIWLTRPLGLDSVRKQAQLMEIQTKRFYEQAARKCSDASVRKLLGDLAEEERHHAHLSYELRQQISESDIESEAETQHRLFVLQVIQPGLAGLMDGSVSTLAPIFAAAFATRSSHDAFIVGLAASIGAGISMGFAEALSDDGSMTGRGHPWMRGIICGLMTTLGGIGHTIPFLITDFTTAMVIASVVVLAELFVISWVRHRYMDTPLLAAIFQVVVGGILVFITGILIGSY